MEEKMIDKPTNGTERKLSYEELEAVAHQLNDQVQNLYNRLQEETVNRMFKRLDYLFKVVEHSIEFPAEFTTKVVKEIIDMMTLPEEDEPKGQEVPTD